MRAVVVFISFLLFLAALPAQGASGEPITVGQAGITYTTRAGDTLSSIAERLTTKRDNWIALSKLNNIAKDVSLPIGTSITIPAELLIDDPTEAKVAALSGSIAIAGKDGKPVLLVPGTKISEGMQINTGNNSFLTLSLPDQSRISIPSNSNIKIAKLRITRYTNSPRTELQLLRGRVESRVAPLEQNRGRFEVFTPQAVAGVRGTHFRIGAGDNGTATEVLSGRVEVGLPGQAGGLMLHAGEGSITDGKTVGKSVQLLPTPQLVEAPTRAEPAAVQLTLTPIPGAQAYHVQIASDPDAQTILTEKRGNSTRMKLDGLPNGDYFARVAAIDRFGLEGPASTHAFSLAAVPDMSMPSAPYVERNDTERLTLKWKGEPGQKFQVQVARDASFSWLLYSGKTDAPEIRLPRPAFGTYYARVQEIYPNGSTSPYSLAQPFVVTDQWIIHSGNPIGTKDAAGTLR